jgi:hypothetical protein
MKISAAFFMLALAASMSFAQTASTGTATSQQTPSQKVQAILPAQAPEVHTSTRTVQQAITEAKSKPAAQAPKIRPAAPPPSPVVTKKP